MHDADLTGAPKGNGFRGPARRSESGKSPKKNGSSGWTRAKRDESRATPEDSLGCRRVSTQQPSYFNVHERDDGESCDCSLPREVLHSNRRTRRLTTSGWLPEGRGTWRRGWRRGEGKQRRQRFDPLLDGAKRASSDQRERDEAPTQIAPDQFAPAVIREFGSRRSDSWRHCLWPHT